MFTNEKKNVCVTSTRAGNENSFERYTCVSEKEKRNG